MTPTRQAILHFLFELLKLAAIATLGIGAFAVTFQLLVSTGALSADVDGEGMGLVLTRQAVLVWMGSILLGFIAIFIHASWKWPLSFAPLYAPALYLVIRALAG